MRRRRQRDATAASCSAGRRNSRPLLKVCGTDEALRLLGESERIAADVAGYLKRHGVDAQLRQDGWLWTASNAAQVDSWMPCIELLAPMGSRPLIALPTDEVRRLSGAAHLAGVLSRSSATVHPGITVRGLRRIALAKGIRIYEHTPMRSLRARPQPKGGHGAGRGARGQGSCWR